MKSSRLYKYLLLIAIIPFLGMSACRSPTKSIRDNANQIVAVADSVKQDLATVEAKLADCEDSLAQIEAVPGLPPQVPPLVARAKADVTDATVIVKQVETKADAVKVAAQSVAKDSERVKDKRNPIWGVFWLAVTFLGPVGIIAAICLIPGALPLVVSVLELAGTLIGSLLRRIAQVIKSVVPHHKFPVSGLLDTAQGLIDKVHDLRSINASK